ncbi:hypothetical protein AB0F91_20065 [Amycolatopsis sp. NPDC023774]|uniref:hypothetical protein n=1 Tax=Amycolatopsis sp. NPDC023774 TaxID=3155015 RepID=UPI0033D1BDD5
MRVVAVPRHVEAAAGIPGVTAELRDETLGGTRPWRGVVRDGDQPVFVAAGKPTRPARSSAPEGTTVTSGSFPLFPTAAEMAAELPSAGVRDVDVFGVAGPAWTALDVEQRRPAPPRRRKSLGRGKIA